MTIADRTAEQAMRAVLAERFPDHGILGEEFGLDRPDARLRWVLDPIDGTRAFITGRPTFGTLIALLDGETPDPRRDRPAGDAASAGSALPGGRPLSAAPMAARAGCRPCASLADAELSCTSPGDVRARTAALAAPGGRGAAQLLGRRLLRATACSRSARSTSSPRATMNLWDWAALVPVVEGAGGRVTDWSRPDAAAGWRRQVLAVGDPALLPQIVALA